MAMDPSSSAKNFEKFEPRFDWVDHPDSHVLVVHLSGFTFPPNSILYFKYIGIGKYIYYIFVGGILVHQFITFFYLPKISKATNWKFR